MIPAWKIYPSSQRRSTVYLKNVVKNPFIEVGDYTVYDDFVNDPRDFERNNVLYHYPECNHDRLRIGRFCLEPIIYRKKTEGGVTDVYQQILGQLYWRFR